MSEAFNAYAELLEIAPGNRAPHHYELLGLALFENDPDEIRSRYWDRVEHVRKYEVGNYTDHAVRLLEELSQAFNRLSDARTKAEYDQRLRRERASTTTVSDVSPTETLSDAPHPAKRDVAGAAPGPQARTPWNPMLWDSSRRRMAVISGAVAGLLVAAIFFAVIVGRSTPEKTPEIAQAPASEEEGKPESTSAAQKGESSLPADASEIDETDEDANEKPSGASSDSESNEPAPAPKDAPGNTSAFAPGSFGFGGGPQSPPASGETKSEESSSPGPTPAPAPKDPFGGGTAANPFGAPPVGAFGAPPPNPFGAPNSFGGRNPIRVPGPFGVPGPYGVPDPFGAPPAAPNTKEPSIGEEEDSLAAASSGTNEKPPSKRASFQRIPLPSGATLDAGMLLVDPDNLMKQVEAQVKEGASLIPLYYDSGESALRAVAAFDTQNRLHGLCVELHPNQEMKRAARYRNADRNGQLWAWSEAGELILTAEYINGRLTGLLCLLEDQQPQLVLEHDKGKLIGIHNVADPAAIRSYADPQDVAADDDQTNTLLARLKEMQSQIDENASALKKQIRDEARSMTREQRSTLAAERSAALGKLIQLRENARRSLNQQQINGIRARTGF